MYCKNCGAQIDDKAVICVSCGVSVEGPKRAANVNVMSIVGVVAAGLSILGFGAVSGIVALVVSMIALGQIKKTGEQGKAFAIIGIVVGAASILLTVLGIAVLFGITQNIISASSYMV